MYRLLALFFVVCLSICFSLGDELQYIEVQQERILGGSDASDGEFPFHVSIQFFQFNWTHFCSGIVLSPTWVLLPMSCRQVGGMIRIDETMRVIAGVSDICEGVSVDYIYDVEEVIVHPNFTLGIGITGQIVTQNDLSLIRVATPFEFNDFLQPAKLPARSTTVSGNGTVIGWGGEDAQFFCRLQKTNQMVIDIEECSGLLGEALGSSEALNAGKFCGLPETITSHSCFWDGGAPFVQDGIVLGLESWMSKSCLQPFVPTVYTQLSLYYDFILEHVLDLPK